MEYRDLFDTPVEPDEFFSQKSPVKKGNNLTMSKSETDISTITTLSEGVKIGQMKHFRKVCDCMKHLRICVATCMCTNFNMWPV